MKLLLGVCGSIAAYKAAELVRLLQSAGVEVQVTLTAAAERFLSPLTFNALSGRPVYTSLWSPDQASHPAGPIEHIAVAQSIDAFLVAPATATTLARLAHGFADDFLSAVALATRAPLLLAPAMNVEMWRHPATQHNLDLLRQRGAVVISPKAGYLACGLTGDGRLADLPEIVDTTLKTLRDSSAAIASADRNHLRPAVDLVGETVLVTAGGTREALDPVRFLGNHSSGRMGHALAAAAHSRGARVLLLTASSLSVEAGIEVVPVTSTAEMQFALQQHLPAATLIFGAAAVADFRPRSASSGKLRRTGPFTLELEPTPDLMAYAASHRRPGALVVAFAAETEELRVNASRKLRQKGVDAIFVNDVAAPGIGFNSEENAGAFITSDGSVELPQTPKRQLADKLLDLTLELRMHGNGAPASSAVAYEPGLGQPS